MLREHCRTLTSWKSLEKRTPAAAKDGKGRGHTPPNFARSDDASSGSAVEGSGSDVVGAIAELLMWPL
jgi:hypothetical protein